jgi:hypothetical protein
MAGAPRGNSNPSKGARLSAFLRERIAERDIQEGIVAVLIAKALDGDMSAIKEIFDRTEGKAMQALELSTPDGFTVTRIERHIVDQAEPVKLVHSAD